MIHLIDVSKTNEEFERHSRRINKRKHFSRHSKSNNRKKHRHKNDRKSSHHRSGENTNASKLKSKHRKKTNLYQTSIKNDYDQSSLDTNLFLENQNNNKMSLDTRTMIRDHLYISILGLFCFFPTGIFGLIRAMQAYEMKRPSSLVYWPKLAAIYGRHALRWAILSILIGTMLWTIFIIYHLLREQHLLWDAFYQECGEQFLCSI